MFELNSTYLNCAYMGPMPLKAKAATEEWLKVLTDPAFSNFEERLQLLAGVRDKFGKLLGVPSLNIALGGSVSEMVGHVANGLNAGDGDEVLLMENDFPSMILPWMVAAERRGFKIRFLPREKFLDPSAFEKELTGRTRYAGCSHVMFNTGIRLPVAEIGNVCRKKEVLFLADTSQSFGGIQITPDIVKNVDILVGVAYKWLLGPYGTAYGYFSDPALDKVRRTHATWQASANMRSTESLLNYTTETVPGAVKFDRGEAPVYLLNAPLDASLGILLEEGLDNIERHNMELARQFTGGIPKGFQVLSTAETLSPIVCFKSHNEDAASLKKKLAANKIDVTIREGFVRASFHLFNTKAEVTRLLSVLEN